MLEFDQKKRMPGPARWVRGNLNLNNVLQNYGKQHQQQQQQQQHTL